MLTSRMAIVVGLASALVVSVCAAHAAPMTTPNLGQTSLTIQVAGGCGPNGWRGPWGHCRNTPYYGPLPGGYYQPEVHPVFGCPEGYWRGPWGHCRNTPYHGPLPGGGWK
jgi:hypothetical protein